MAACLLAAPGMEGPGHQGRQQPLGLGKTLALPAQPHLKTKVSPSRSPHPLRKQDGESLLVFFCYEEVQLLVGSGLKGLVFATPN